MIDYSDDIRSDFADLIGDIYADINNINDCCHDDEYFDEDESIDWSARDRLNDFNKKHGTKCLCELILEYIINYSTDIKTILLRNIGSFKCEKEIQLEFIKIGLSSKFSQDRSAIITSIKDWNNVWLIQELIDYYEKGIETDKWVKSYIEMTLKDFQKQKCKCNVIINSMINCTDKCK